MAMLEQSPDGEEGVEALSAQAERFPAASRRL